MNQSEIRIIDNLIPSVDLINDLKTLCEIYCDYKKNSDNDNRFSWFETLGSSITAIPFLPSRYHLSLSRYYLDHLMPVLYPYRFDSFKCEWWCNTNNILDWHIDKNESLYERSKIYNLPLLSTVFYPFSDCSHGELFVGSHVPIDQDHFGSLPGFDSSTLIPPVVNRLVLFSPGLLHKIMPFSGSRFSIAMNIWPI